MQNLAVFVIPDLKDDRIQSITHPPDCQKLFRNVGSPIKPIWPREQFTRFFKPYAAPGIRSEAPALSRVEAKAHPI